eukprot:Transcript_4872.p1 GENE.Transcript_4872~~Transcript_4872.p1  ORF type:complete len:470 (+),score=86.57 Transcript_4872:40-1449(+)
MALTACRPRLFVYDLPARYRDEGRSGGYGRLVQYEQGVLPPNLRLYAAKTYGTGSVVYTRAMHHACRTEDASAADVFLVPTFSENLRAGGRTCADAPPTHRKNCSAGALFARLQRVACGEAGPSCLDARDGRDHMLITGKQGFSFDRRPYFEVSYTDPRFGKAVRLAVEQAGDYRWPGGHSLAFWHSMPWASMVHVQPSLPWADVPWRARRAGRTVLVSGSFGLHRAGANTGAAKQFNSLRGALHRTCGTYPSSICTFLAPNHVALNQEMKEPAGQRNAMVTRVTALYYQSVFCLQPVGDGVSRAAMIDAVLLGCIPVLFHPGQRMQWPWHWGGWVQQATVELDMASVISGTLNVVEALRNISAAAVSDMQKTIAAHGHCLHYLDRNDSAPTLAAPVDGGGNVTRARQRIGSAMDAFDITLHGSWLLATGGDPANGSLCRSHRDVKREVRGTSPSPRKQRLGLARSSQR